MVRREARLQGCEYQQGIQSRSRAEKEKRGKLGRSLKGLGKGFFFFFSGLGVDDIHKFLESQQE